MYGTDTKNPQTRLNESAKPPLLLTARLLSPTRILENNYLCFDLFAYSILTFLYDSVSMYSSHRCTFGLTGSFSKSLGLVSDWRSSTYRVSCNLTNTTIKQVNVERQQVMVKTKLL